jgi:Zn-dependent protease with chaperone function
VNPGAPVQADYYDGKSAKRNAASVTVVGGVVVVAYEGGSSEYALSTVRVQPRLQGAPRRMEFPDGSAAIADDHAAIEAAFEVGSVRTLVHRLESHVGFVVGALIGVIGSVAFGYFYGVPWTAREIALRLPIGIETQIAEFTLKSLDQAFFAPTKLDSRTRAEISSAFDGMRATTELPPTVRLEFRGGGWIGANAFALPGGVVVVTDQLVKVMPGEDEIAAVLAHELGHVQHRHSLRHLFQNSILALATAAIYGDVASLTGIAVTAPTVLAHNGYSRGFEREADAFAFTLLNKTGRSPRAFASALRALEKSHKSGGKKRETRTKPESPDFKPAPSDAPDSGTHSDFSYLSTHPATSERIRAAEAAGGGK